MKILQLLRRDEGANLLEYSLIFILSMLMILGIMDFGRTMYIYHYVSNTAREASRWAAVNGYTCHDDGTCSAPAKDTDIAAYVSNITPPGLSSSNPPLVTTVTWPVQSTSPAKCSTTTTQTSPGCTVQVQVSYTFNFLFPLVYNSPLTLSSTSMMVISH